MEKLLCHREAQPATVLPDKRDNPSPQLNLTLAANHHKGLRSSEVQELAPRRVYGPPAPALSGYIGKRSVD